jgi:DNA end-binding protein Ku
MSKALWKGHLSLGLINIPVRLYPETRPRDPSFSMVDRRDLSPIGVTYVNKKTGERVPPGDIARAATLPGGERVIVPDAVLEELAGDGTHAVRVVGFTPIGEISPVHFQTPYFLEPSPDGEKGYTILLEALKRTRKAAIARVVVVHREKIAVLWPDHAILMMSVLRWPGELRRPARLTHEPPPPQAAGILPEELEAAEELVDTMTVPWDPQEFRDESREKVRAWFDRRSRDAVPPVREVPAVTPQGILLNFLERSVKAAREQKKSHPSRTA